MLRMRTIGSAVSCLLFACFLLASSPNPGFGFSDDFEDGNSAGWDTWTCSGTTDNVVGPGFTLTVEGGGYARTGSYGLHAHRTMVIGADVLETPTGPHIGLVHFAFDVRPFTVSSGSTHSQIFWLSEGSGRVSETGSSNLGISFNANGTITGRSTGYPTLGTYTPNQWCHVEIDLNTANDLFSVQVSGPGVAGIISRSDLPFEENLATVNYIEIYCDQQAPSDFGLDNISVTHSVSGYVRDASGVGVAGVQVNKGCDVGGYTTTDANGYWVVNNISAATCTFTPSKSGCTFSPPSRTITGGTNNADFVSTCPVGPCACSPPSPGPGDFSDNFESGGIFNLRWWSPSGGVLRQPGAICGGTEVARGSATGEADAALVLRDPCSLNWSGYSYEYDVVFNSNDAYCYSYGYFFVQTLTNWLPDGVPGVGYAVVLKAQQDVVALTKFPGGDIVTAPFSVSPGTAYHVKITTHPEGASQRIEVFINCSTSPILSVLDNTYTHGTIGLGASTGGGGGTQIRADFDNILVRGPGVTCPTTVQSTTWSGIKARYSGVVGNSEER